MDQVTIGLITRTVSHYFNGNIISTKAYAFKGDPNHTVLFFKTDIGGALSADYHKDGYVWIGCHEGKTERSKIILGNYFRPVY